MSAKLSRPTLKSSAERRLLRDMKELLVEQPKYISAEPLPQNLFEWHCNILAPVDSPYSGICMHLVMNFSEQYPVHPPIVHLCTSISHSHVFDSHICLDLLETHASEEPYSGWSTSYTVLSILLQLQSFFLDDEDWEQFGRLPKTKVSVRSEVQESLQFVCKKCAHDATSGKPWPWHWNSLKHGNCGWKYLSALTVPKTSSWVHGFSSLSSNVPVNGLKNQISSGSLESLQPHHFPTLGSAHPDKNQQQQQKNKKKKQQMQEQKEQSRLPVGKKRKPYLSLVLTLPNEILIQILSYLDDILIKQIETNIKAFAACAGSPYLWARRELVCFHTKQNMGEDVLGIGLRLEFGIGSRKLQSVLSPLDIISRSAFFDDNIRLSVWKEKFQFFLPLYISSLHAKRAIPLFGQCLNDIYKDVKVEGAHKNHVVLALDLLTKLMSSMVVEIMKGHTHASIKALEGYGHFQRWMIHLVQENPGLLEAIDRKVMQVVNSPESIHKDVLPNLGEFLPLLSVSSVKWSQVCVPLIEEALTRNALWIRSKYPELALNNGSVRTVERLEKSFECSKVGLHLIMFHMHFLRVSRTDGKKMLNLQEIADQYDKRFGKTAPKMQEELQGEIFKIQKTNNYEQFFAYVAYPLFKGIQLNTGSINNVLITAMKEMDRKGYFWKPNSGRFVSTRGNQMRGATRGRGIRGGRGRGRGTHGSNFVPSSDSLTKTTSPVSQNRFAGLLERS